MSASPVAGLPPSTAERVGSAASWRERLTPGVLVANLVAQIAIIVTGGAVRLTSSGLGCSTWPECEPGQFAPVFHEEMSIHQAIEFGNRTLTGVLSVIALAVALLVWTDRSRSRSYRLLGFAPLAGVVAQAVIGGVTVLLHLNPAVVSSHLLVSMALVAVSTLLVRRRREGDGAPVPLVTPATVLLGRVLAVVLVVVLALGTVTTGAGPHSGDDDVAYRFAIDPLLMSRIHALAVWVFVAVLVAMLVTTRLVTTRGAGRELRRAGWVVVVVVALQGVIGYVQVATDVPAPLVLAHMLGAALLTTSTTWYLLALRTRR